MRVAKQRLSRVCDVMSNPLSRDLNQVSSQHQVNRCPD
jgi:hypothetical protein